MIRAIRPEALVTLNGIPFEVGGLKGQTNQAFLTEQMINNMTVSPMAFRFVGYSTGRIKERLSWKQVRHHAPSTQWPPKGVSIRFHFKLPVIDAGFTSDFLGSGVQNTNALPSALGREKLLYDDFEIDRNHWRTQISSSHFRSSFNNEGKGGEIYTPVNSAVFKEGKLPKGTHSLETRIFLGTDDSDDYAPGIAVVFKNGKTLKFFIRTNTGSQNKPLLAVFDGKRKHLITNSPSIDLTKVLGLRIRDQKGKLFFDSKYDNTLWKTYLILKKPFGQGEMTMVRVGKTDSKGGYSESMYPGKLCRLHIEDFTAYSEFNSKGIEDAQKQLKKLQEVEVQVVYQIYDGIPLIDKTIEVHNHSQYMVTLDKFVSEELALVEKESPVSSHPNVGIDTPNGLHIETDYAFGGVEYKNGQRHVIHWDTDPNYTSQVNYLLKNPCLLHVAPSVGPSQDIPKEGVFKSYTTFELAQDSQDNERRGLSRKKMYRTIAPWVTENPLMLHCVSSELEVIKKAIDQCASIGFEMLILSFGSGFDMENDTPKYLKKWKKIANYAHNKGVEIGAYSLLASRHIGGGNDVVSPKGTRPTFGNCPALTSPWGLDYYRKIRNFYDKTGFSLLEHDGPYPGDIDITSRPPFQKGALDSRWVQWRLTDSLYRDLRSKGVYMNTPDRYFLNGSNKMYMGYREVNWSLPRAEQVIHTRQNIYDGTWNRTPSMGWMFVPLTVYHGGGIAATIEPLDDHLDHYEKMLYSNLAMGVQPTYRGDRPNVIIIYADDLGYGDVSCYGATKLYTPHIDALANNGIRFTNGHCSSATCTPSRYALITGKYPWRKKGIAILPGDAELIIPTDQTSLPNVFQQAGYTTGIVGKWHLGLGQVHKDWNKPLELTPNDVGFDYSFIFPATADRVPTVFLENRDIIALDEDDPLEVSYQHKVGNDPTGKEHPELLKLKSSRGHGHNQTIVNGIGRIGYMSGGHTAHWVDEELSYTFLNKAKEFIGNHKDVRFFLYYSPTEPHVPRMPATIFKDKSGLGFRGDAILQLDWSVGEIVKELKRLGIYDNTMIIFTSDNGPVLDDGYVDGAVTKLNGHKPSGPLRGGKYSAFEGGTRVPFIVSYPKEVKVQTSDALVCQIDFLASFTTMLNQEYSEVKDSQNLMEVLLGQSHIGRETLVEAAATLSILDNNGWKYIEPSDRLSYYKLTDTESGNFPKPQLYNLKNDLGEKHNLATDKNYKKILKNLQKKLKETKEQVVP
ncbi:arylsulfatase [Elysia marginata]|uniref:Arylsulfatase n=1 Tax=Elysia marginata TaxID=1093978 RepID=A0AAV4FWE9_9GAST|nr:arylsulfatase [Elysia marginata]